MKTSLRVRLTLGYLMILLIGMGIAAGLAWLGVENLYLESQRQNLLAQARLVAATLGGDVNLPTEPGEYNQTANVLPGIHTRIIDAEGAVVIDLRDPAPLAGGGGVALPQLAQNASRWVTPEELLARPEIAAALAGDPATAIRHVEAAGGGRVLYAAAPVLTGNGEVAQIVYLASPLPDTQWSALPEGIRWQFLGALALAMLLAGAVGALLARRLSHPLGRLAVAASRVAAGDLQQQVPEDATLTEMSVVSRAFNSMTASLRQSDQAKTAFISDVSHELRTPLTVIKGTIETLQDGAVDDLEARGPFLESMDRETERLIRLVNDLLVLTRADAGALNLRRETIDLAALARARCRALESLAAGRGVRLTVEGGEPLLVNADADRLSQVLNNLLDNAIHYSPPGGDVRVSLAQAGDRVTCRVTDAGEGIPAEHLPHIFDRFYRVEAARQRTPESPTGSGLGLAIARSLVEAHGGQVAAESAPGQGTTVTFWLPSLRSSQN